LTAEAKRNVTQFSEAGVQVGPVFPPERGVPADLAGRGTEPGEQTMACNKAPPDS
ncbi:Hypothetical predicted protein, partial [Marmota monax]